MAEVTDRPDLVGDGWDDEPLMKVDDVAKALACSRSLVYELAIPQVRIRSGCIRWRPQDVRAYIERRLVA